MNHDSDKQSNKSLVESINKVKPKEGAASLPDAERIRMDLLELLNSNGKLNLIKTSPSGSEKKS